jgi:hypothetical protein
MDCGSHGCVWGDDVLVLKGSELFVYVSGLVPIVRIIYGLSLHRPLLRLTRVM